MSVEQRRVRSLTLPFLTCRPVRSIVVADVEDDPRDGLEGGAQAQLPMRSLEGHDFAANVPISGIGGALAWLESLQASTTACWAQRSGALHEASTGVTVAELF